MDQFEKHYLQGAMRSTLESIRTFADVIEGKVNAGKYAEAADLKDDLKMALSTLGDQIETHLGDDDNTVSLSEIEGERPSM